MKTILLLFFCYFFSFGQNTSKQLDSLQWVLKNKKLSYQEQVEVLNKLSLKYMEFNLDSAQVFNNRILSISKEKKYDIGLGFYNLNKADVLMSIQNYTSAEHYARRSQFYFLRAKHTNDFIMAVYAQAFALDFLGKNDLSEELVLKTINAYENHTDNTNIVELYYFLSTLYKHNKQPKIVFFYITKALRIYTKNNNDVGIFKCYFQLGTVCLINEIYPKAIYYFERCDKILQSKFKNKLEYQLNLNLHLSYVYVKQRNFNMALKYSLRNEEISLKRGFTSIDFDNKMTLIKIYIGLKQYNKALQYVKIIDNSDVLDNELEYDLNRYNILKGKLYFHLKDYTKSLAYAKKSYAFNSKDIDALQLLIAIYSSLSDYKQAYHHQQVYIRLKEDQFLFDRNNSIDEYEALFQIEERERELKYLNLLLKNNEFQLQRKNSYIFLAVVAILSLCIIFILLFYNYSTKRKSIHVIKQKNESLSSINTLLTQSNLEKEILLKEIHHRVKNNLQLVISMLNIQVYDSNQATIKQFLEIGRMRIATMSLIHQTLYQSHNFTNINFQEYLEKLVTNIKLTFEANDVDISVNTNGNTFDLDTSIPLGLIINELVCNIFKHAFPNDFSGMIYIAIDKIEGDVYELRIGDNGVGVEDRFAITTSESIGIELVSLLVMQLQGKLKICNQYGTHYIIEFRAYL